MADDKNAALIAEARKALHGEFSGRRWNAGGDVSLIRDLADALEAAEAKIARVEAKCVLMDTDELTDSVDNEWIIAKEIRAALDEGVPHG